MTDTPGVVEDVLPVPEMPAQLEAPALAGLEVHGLAVLAYARGRFRSSWHALDDKAQADVKTGATALAQVTLTAIAGGEVTKDLREVREFMRAWPWAGRRAAAKHLQRGAAHVAFQLAAGLALDERRAALRHSAKLMGGKPSKAKHRRR